MLINIQDSALLTAASSCKTSRYSSPKNVRMCLLATSPDSQILSVAMPAGVPENMLGEELVGYTVHIFEAHNSEFAHALITAYDKSSDCHSLLFDDFGLQERQLALHTMRLLEPSESVLDALAAPHPAHESAQLCSLLHHPGGPSLGSSSALSLLESSPTAQHPFHHKSLLESAQQTSISSQLSEAAASHCQNSAACEEALLHSGQMNGASPDACLLPETADRIQMHSSSSAAELCWQGAPSFWDSSAAADVLSFDDIPAVEHAAPTTVSDYPEQYHFGDPMEGELDLERLWADEL